jgi:hypothetical protein
VAACYRRASDNHGLCKVGSESGNAITFGSASEFNTTNTTYTSVSSLDTARFAVAYSGSGYGIIGQEEEQQQAIPELPKNNVWKIVVAILALALVIGIAAWRKKKRTPAKPEEK